MAAGFSQTAVLQTRTCVGQFGGVFIILRHCEPYKPPRHDAANCQRFIVRFLFSVTYETSNSVECTKHRTAKGENKTKQN